MSLTKQIKSRRGKINFSSNWFIPCWGGITLPLDKEIAEATGFNKLLVEYYPTEGNLWLTMLNARELSIPFVYHIGKLEDERINQCIKEMYIELIRLI